VKAIKHSLSAAAGVLLLSGCTTHGGGVSVHSPGSATPRDLPPAHAPAYGRRAQQRYHYRYFPDAQVYFDLDRKLYFYISANRWRVSVSLPHYLQIRLGERQVSLEMDTDKPYQEFRAHKKRYPPGQLKKKAKKNNAKGRGNKQDEREYY
jgi:hypothetical protein